MASESREVLGFKVTNSGEKNTESPPPNVSNQKSVFHIDKQMWRFKLHYFILFGGLATSMPYIPMYAKNRIGLSNTAIAVILMGQQFSFIITKPLIGYLADYFNKLKAIICTLTVMQTVCIFLILAVPAIDEKVSSPNSLCLSAFSNSNITVDCMRLPSQINSNSDIEFNRTIHCICNEEKGCQECSLNSTANITPLYVEDLESNSRHEFQTHQFWLFALIYGFGMICSNAVFTLSDTACCESLKKFGASFGRQRLWAAMSWGLFAPLAGYINDYTGDYLISWIITGVCSIFTIWNIANLDLIKPQFSLNVLQDFWTVVKSGEFLVFEIGLLMNGIGAAIIWYYLILFLNSIGASKFLCGLSLTVQCFLGSIPLMFYSENIIKKLGHLNVASLSLLMYAVRFMWYSYLRNPWFTLVVEALHGITFGLLQADIASYGKERAKAGTEATTQSVLFSTHEGLGAGLGCVLGGLGLDHLGGHMTLFVASLFAMCGLVLHQILILFVTRNKRTMKVTPEA